jgi:hypothetical protein
MGVVVWEEGLTAHKWQAQYISYILTPHTTHSMQKQTGSLQKFGLMGG